jgi:phosphoglycolate phosphatase-like HAD superfamily hydrolase
VGVTWGFRPRSDLVAAGAEVVVDEPRDLVAAILRRG